MKRDLVGLAATLLLVVSGCGAAVKASMAPDVDLGRYRTFAWYTPVSPRGPETPADQEIKAAIRRSLAAKGIVEAAGGNPDFLVTYHIVLQEEEDTEWGFAYPPGAGPETYIDIEGTLVVDFIDPRQDRVIWRGTASQVVNTPDRVHRMKLDDAVSKMLTRYPGNVAQAPGSPPPM
ncbi:MAG TPA: DUF4136 domain-containing protein [Polyangia bacterium]|jgi:hypothetical protein